MTCKVATAAAANLLLLVLLVLQSAKILLAREDYKDYKVYQVQPQNDEQMQILLNLANKQWELLPTWRNESGIKALVSSQGSGELVKLLAEHHIEHQLLIDDLSPFVRAQRAENLRSKSRYQLPYIDVLGGFYTHEEINTYLDSLPERYPKRAQIRHMGWSYERRALKVLTISNGDGRRNKPVILIDGTVHAREWISPSMALYIIQQLLDNDAENMELLEDYDWVIMPVVNADGYEYTHTDSRYWRKTRKPNDNIECIGTDLNRNFAHEWGHEAGSSSDSCNETYRGARPFDQPESQVLRDLLLSYSGRLSWYLSLHSYGNYFLLPWGYTRDFPDNYYDMLDVATTGAMAIVHATNGIYTAGSTYHVLYATSGDSADYAKAVANATVAMTMELPAGGFSGFDPWVSHIEGIVTESWVGVRAMANDVIRRYPSNHDHK
ncbi:carboxypeptidase B [Drosophila willistoni]|nr:carboxypeptidase B [Drosophila willistoni]